MIKIFFERRDVNGDKILIVAHDILKNIKECIKL
jgi:hypothetical protein